MDWWFVGLGLVARHYGRPRRLVFTVVGRRVVRLVDRLVILDLGLVVSHFGLMVVAYFRLIRRGIIRSIRRNRMVAGLFGRLRRWLVLVFEAVGDVLDGWQCVLQRVMHVVLEGGVVLRSRKLPMAAISTSFNDLGLDMAVFPLTFLATFPNVVVVLTEVGDEVALVVNHIVVEPFGSEALGRFQLDLVNHFWKICGLVGVIYVRVFFVPEANKIRKVFLIIISLGSTRIWRNFCLLQIFLCFGYFRTYWRRYVVSFIAINLRTGSKVLCRFALEPRRRSPVPYGQERGLPHQHYCRPQR